MLPMRKTHPVMKAATVALDPLPATWNAQYLVCKTSALSQDVRRDRIESQVNLGNVVPSGVARKPSDYGFDVRWST